MCTHRHAMRDSDFGTFRRRSVTSLSTSTTHSMGNMSETNIAPSLEEPYVPRFCYYCSTTIASCLAAATAATTPASDGGLQERLWLLTNQQQQHDESASDAHGDAYSSQP